MYCNFYNNVYAVGSTVVRNIMCTVVCVL